MPAPDKKAELHHQRVHSPKPQTLKSKCFSPKCPLLGTVYPELFGTRRVLVGFQHFSVVHGFCVSALSGFVCGVQGFVSGRRDGLLRDPRKYPFSQALMVLDTGDV